MASVSLITAPTPLIQTLAHGDARSTYCAPRTVRILYTAEH